MSTPDDPTRRIPPGEPLPPREPLPRASEREYVAPDDGAWRQHVLDRIDSLRTWLAAVTLIALLAAGLAAYTLLTAEEEDDARAGASREQVSELSDRVDDLDSKVDDRASERSVGDVRDAQQDLEERVKAVENASERQADEGGDTEQLQQSVDELSDSIQQLDERLTEVERRQDEAEQQP